MGGFSTAVPQPSPAALDIRPPQQTEAPLDAVLRYRALQQEQQLRGQQIQTAQTQNQMLQAKMRSQQAMAEALKDWDPATPPTSIISQAAKNGALGEDLAAMQQHFADMRQKNAAADTAELNLRNQQHDRARGLLDAAMSAKTPELKQQFWNSYQGAEQSLEPGAQVPAQYPGDEVAQALSNGHALHSQFIDDQLKQQQKATAKAQENEATATAAVKTAEAPGAQAESDIKVASANALKTMTDADWQQAIDNMVPDKNSPLYRRTVSQVQFARRRGDLKGAQDAIKAAGEQLGATEKAVATAQATAPIKVNIAGQEEAARNAATGLTPEAVDMAAELFRKTGQMPGVARNKGAQQQILDRAAQMDKTEGPVDLATNQAAFKANQQSLEGLQKNLDSVSAFENTAKANLDLFLTQAQRVVDSGSPWLNKPLRSVARNGLGSADQAAYDAARQVAINEIAKVTGNPGLSGQLSDSARHEVEAFNPNTATLAQTYRVAQVLKQDMANRRQAYQDQIESIRGRIGGATRPQTPAPQTAGTGGGQTGAGAKPLIIRMNGKRYQYNGSGATEDLKNYTELK